MAMKDIDLFQMALGLTPPWQVSSSEFDAAAKRLDIEINFARGSTFSCPKCQRAGMKVHDTVSKTWRHLNFLQHEAYLTARVARIDCDQCGVKMVSVPW
jgi:transposase